MLWDAVTISLPYDFDKDFLNNDLKFFDSTKFLDTNEVILINDACENVGSGGSTLNALLFTAERLCAKQGLSVLSETVLENTNILIILLGSEEAAHNILDPSDPFFRSNQSFIFNTSLCHAIENASKIALKSSVKGLWIIGTDSHWQLCQKFYKNLKTIDFPSDSITTFSFKGSSNILKTHGVYQIDEKNIVTDLKYCSDDEISTEESNIIVAFLYIPSAIASILLNFHSVHPLSATTFYGIDSGAVGMKLSLFFDFVLATCSSLEEFLDSRVGGHKVEHFQTEMLTSSRILIHSRLYNKKCWNYSLNIQNYQFQNFGCEKKDFNVLHQKLVEQLINSFSLRDPKKPVYFDALLSSLLSLQKILKIDSKSPQDYFNILRKYIEKGDLIQNIYTFSLALSYDSSGLGGLRSGPADNPSLAKFLKVIRESSNTEANDAFGGLIDEISSNWRNDPHRMIRAARHLEAAAQIQISKNVNQMCDHQRIVIQQQNNSGGLTPKRVTVAAPLRVDLYGGWLDTPPIFFSFDSTAVFNLAIQIDGLPIRCSITNSEKKGILEIRGGEVTTQILSDQQLLETCRKPTQHGALVCACLTALGISITNLLRITKFDGIQFDIESNVPHGSGLGTSSILASAIIKAIVLITKCSDYSSEKLVTTVLKVEQVMTTGGGWQDQVGAIYAGLKMGRTRKKRINEKDVLEIECDPIKISSKFESELNQRLVLIFTGRTRLAKNIQQEVIRNWYSENETREILQEVHDGIDEFKREIENGKMPIDLINRYSLAKQILTNGCQPKLVTDLFELLETRNIIETGWMAGAGGGGFCYCWLTKSSNISDIDQILQFDSRFSQMFSKSVVVHNSTSSDSESFSFQVEY